MKKFLSLAAAALVSLGLWAATETDVFDQSGAVANTAYVKKGTTLPGNYIAGQGGAAIKDYIPENKGLKLRTQNTFVTIDDVKYGYAILSVNKGCAVRGIKLEGTSNGSNAINLHGVYADIDTTAAAIVGAIKAATNQLTAPVSFPNKSTTYVGTPDLTFDATTNVLFLFDVTEDNQLRTIITATFEVTATPHSVTYKANYGAIADSTETEALVVKDNMFPLPEDKYFIGWNDKADGTGNAVAVGADLTQDTVLYAQWKAFVGCVRLTIAAQGASPEKGGEVALRLGSNAGGKMYFAGAKEDDYEASFIYKPQGMQMSKGGADSIRVELDEALAAGAIVRLVLVAANAGIPSLNIVTEGKAKTIPFIAVTAVAAGDTVSVYYTVKAGDGLAGAKKLWIQRGASTIIVRTLAIQKDASCEAAAAPFSEDNKLASMKINNESVSQKDGLFSYEVPGDFEGTEVEVAYTTADANAKAKDAAQASPFKLAVPEVGAKTSAILVIAAQDGTEKSYPIEITKAAPAPKSKDVTIKSLTINGKAVTIDADKVYAYEVEADADLKKVAVAFELNDAKASADKSSPFDVDVPDAGEPANEVKLTVTAEDTSVKQEYTIRVTRATPPPADAVTLEFAYCDAWYIAEYEAWEFNLYKDYDPETEEVTYPDGYIGVFAKHESKIAGTYVADEELVYITIALAEGDTINDASLEDLTITLVDAEKGQYKFSCQFLADDGKTYVISATVETLAFDADTETEIELTDGKPDPDPDDEGIENANAMQKVVKAIQNGQVVIIFGDKQYNMNGSVIR